MSSLVSVVVPCRNAAATVDEALASVLAQRGVDLDVLVIDDGSTDNSVAHVERIARADPRVRIVRTEHGGIVSALRRGVAESRGDWIARMDADDIALPDRFAAQFELARSDPALAVVATRVRVECIDGTPVGAGLLRYVQWQNELLTTAEHARDIFVEAPVCHPSVIIRRTALETVGGYRDTPWPEDYDLWLRLHAQGHAMAKTRHVGLVWRHHAQRLTFSDPRYAPESHRRAKATYLAPIVRASDRELVVWGAGPVGRRLARALEAEGMRAGFFVDIDPKKIGGIRRGVRVHETTCIDARRHFVVVAVGATGAREQIRESLLARGLREREQFVCAA